MKDLYLDLCSETYGSYDSGTSMQEIGPRYHDALYGRFSDLPLELGGKIKDGGLYQSL
jgi:hypothetical protein